MKRYTALVLLLRQVGTNFQCSHKLGKELFLHVNIILYFLKREILFHSKYPTPFLCGTFLPSPPPVVTNYLEMGCVKKWLRRPVLANSNAKSSIQS